MKKIALIGNPVSHSLSPLLFALAYSDSGVQDLNLKSYTAEVKGEEYSYEIVESSNIEEALSILKSGDYIGANVTAPYKEQIMRYVTHPDDISLSVQATNLILFKGNEIHSFNTDYMAALSFLQREDRCPQKFYIIGCGGVAKASAIACCNYILNCGQSHLNKIVLSNRNYIKALEFATKLQDKIDFVVAPFGEIAQIFSNDTYESKILFYTLPTDTKILEYIGRNASGNVRVIEPNYLAPSKFEKDRANISYIGGIEWLIEQAIYGFSIFTGEKPNKGSMYSLVDLKK